MTVPATRISSPADLLGVVPFLLGFTPDDSVGVVVLRLGRVDAAHAMDQLAYVLPCPCPGRGRRGAGRGLRHRHS